MNKIIKILIYSLFFAFPFAQLTKIPGLPTGINLYLHDIIITLLLIFYISTNPKHRPKLSQPILIFIITAIFSLIFNAARFPTKQIFISGLYLVRFTAYSGLYFVFTDKRIKKLKIPLKKLLIYSSLAVAVFGIIQYIFVPDTRFLTSLNWDDHYYRVISTFGDPSYVGAILLLGLILAISAKFSPWIYPVYLIPLFLTYSRSTYLALITAVLAYSLIKRRFKILLISILSLAVILPFLPQPGGEGVNLTRIFSITSRFDNYQESIDIFKQSPVFGIGFNTLRYYRHDFISHSAAGLDSSLLFVLVTTGIIGLLAYLNLLFNIWRQSNLIKISLIILLTHSLFQNTLFYPWIMIWIWTLTATEHS